MARVVCAWLALCVSACWSAGCGSPLNSAGQACTQSDECGAGLSCLGITLSSGSGCATEAIVCSKACQKDEDCAAVGPKFKCFTCGGKGTCGQTE